MLGGRRTSCVRASVWLIAALVAVAATALALRHPWASVGPGGAGWGEALWASAGAWTGTGTFVDGRPVWSTAGDAVRVLAGLGGALGALLLYGDRVWLRRAPRGVRRRCLALVAAVFLVLVAAVALALAPGLGAGRACMAAVGAAAQTGWHEAAYDGETIGAGLRVFMALLPLSLVAGVGAPAVAGAVRALVRGRPFPLHARFAAVGTAVAFLVAAAMLLAPRLVPQIAGPLELGLTANRPEAASPGAALRGGLADASFEAVATRGLGRTAAPAAGGSAGLRTVWMGLMALGGIGGGTAGGLGLVSCAALLAGALAAIRGRLGPWREPLAAAAVLVTAYGVLGFFAVFALAAVEPVPLGKIAFAVTACLSNGGIGIGVASTLTTFGQGVLLALMLVGRLGPPLVLGRLLAPRVATRGRLYLG